MTAQPIRFFKKAFQEHFEDDLLDKLKDALGVNTVGEPVITKVTKRQLQTAFQNFHTWVLDATLRLNICLVSDDEAGSSSDVSTESPPKKSFVKGPSSSEEGDKTACQANEATVSGRPEELIDPGPTCQLIIDYADIICGDPKNARGQRSIKKRRADTNHNLLIKKAKEENPDEENVLVELEDLTLKDLLDQFTTAARMICELPQYENVGYSILYAKSVHSTSAYLQELNNQMNSKFGLSITINTPRFKFP